MTNEIYTHEYRQDIDRFIPINHHYNFRKNNSLGIPTNNYWEEQYQYNQILNNEQGRYNYFKQKEQSLLCTINRELGPILLWRYIDKFYYRPNQFGKLIVGNEKIIAREISSRYGNINIHFVDDLNDVLFYKNKEIRIDTTYIATNSIPVVDNEVFNINHPDEIFFNQSLMYSRNTLSYTHYLYNRFHPCFLTNNETSTALNFIKCITNNKNPQYLHNSLGQYFQSLTALNAIILVGNKDVSEGIFLKRIIETIFGSKYCITITNNILQTMSTEEILKNKLIYHINHIPDEEEDRKKLRDLLISILVDKFIQIDNQHVSINGQVLITIDEAHPFLKDFSSCCDVFFVDSMENILNKVSEENEFTFYKNLYDSLGIFSKELSAIENITFLPAENDTYNKEFFEYMHDINIQTSTMANSIDNKFILDPYDDSIDILIPELERQKHTYITGQTGSGKSLLLTTLLYRDIIKNDSSIILLDPHGDLAENVVKLVKDKTRLIYINPFMSEDKTPTINLFHLIDNSESNIARITQVILNVLKSVNSDESFSGAMEDILENCIRTLLRQGQGSFKELYRFMNDNRNKDLVNYGKASPNPIESEFFSDDFDSSKPTKDAIRRRLKKLLNDPIFSNLMNGDQTINFEKEMNITGNIIIFNIPKGKMPNTYKYYIRFIVEYIQIIALNRSDLEEDKRVHTHLYIDEAHNFISSSATISEILTESRKYKLFVTFAHQAITQIKDTNLRDLMTSMTNVKIIGKNSNKTLDIMNKTLNTKLQDVEKLETGEFYLASGNNEILKVTNTDKLLNSQENISDYEWQEHKKYQLEQYYRNIHKLYDVKLTTEELNKKMNEFINACKSTDIHYFEKVKENKELYDELIYNFQDKSRDANGYISKQDLFQYFNLIHPNNCFKQNKDILKLLQKTDSFFKQNVNINKTYNGKKRFII